MERRVKAKGIIVVPLVVALVLTSWIFHLWRQSEEVFNFSILDILSFLALPFIGFYLIIFIVSLFIVSVRK